MIPLEVQNLKKIYRHNGKLIEAVVDVSLSIKTGEVLAFLGPNGAGKTTTVKIIAGLISPNSGWVRIAGQDPHRNSQALKRLGTVLEGNRNLYWRLTAEENLVYFGILKGLSSRAARRLSVQLLERFGLLPKRSTPVQALSRGMQQKLAIAASLIHQPSLLLFDEPTLGLDVEATEDIKVLVREIAREGHAILLTTHQMNVAEELSDRVAIINKGRIIAEKPTHELLKQFSGTAYTIEIEGKLDVERIRDIDALGATVYKDQIIYIRNPEKLYQVFDILKPLPLVRLEKDQADLTEIFLKLLRE
jgi:ABC-2 type transport system ATP-binding protein